jgi:hypothetical protein
LNQQFLPFNHIPSQHWFKPLFIFIIISLHTIEMVLYKVQLLG